MLTAFIEKMLSLVKKKSISSSKRANFVNQIVFRRSI